MENMKLRTATADDIPTLEHWDTRPHVREHGGEDDLCDWAREIARPDELEVLIAEDGGRPVGVILLLDLAKDSDNYWQSREEGVRAIDIWLGDAADLGKGYGTWMMRSVFDRAFNDPIVHTILIDPLTSNAKAHRFYERLGYTFLENRRFGPDDCRVYRIRREDYEAGLPARNSLTSSM